MTSSSTTTTRSGENKLYVYVARGEYTSPLWGAAFAGGCGSKAVIVEDAVFRTMPIAMFGSRTIWSVLLHTQESGLDWYYGDHGYFGRRVYYRCTRNAYQHNGSGAADATRFEALKIAIKPWRKTGRNILVCPPNRPFARLFGLDERLWLREVLRKIAKHTDRPVMVRPRSTSRPLAADLDDSFAVVTYMSNAAVEAVIAGVPVFCLGKCAARAMGLDDLGRVETPVYPDREQWAWNLAANQWTLEEMRQGMLWRAIGV